MTNPKDARIIAAIRRQDQGVLYEEIGQAQTGKLTDDGGAVYNDPAVGLDAGYIWIRRDDQHPAERALCIGIYGIRFDLVKQDVLVGINRKTRALEVISLAQFSIRERFQGNAIAATTPRIAIAARDYRPGRLRLKTADTLTFVVDPFPYLDANGDEAYWNGIGEIDILSDVPGSADQHVLVRIALDPNATSPALMAVAGTPVSVSQPLDESAIPAISLPSGYISLAAVRLINGDTTVDESRIFDARQMINMGGVDALDDLSDVNTGGAADGDVLTYGSGTWTPQTPTGGGGASTPYFLQAASGFGKRSVSGAQLPELSDVNAAWITSGVLDPARIYTAVTVTTTGNIDDLDFADATLIRLNNASDATIRGLLAGVAGQTVVIESVGAGNVYLAHENAGSTAANRLTNSITSISTPLAAGKGRAVYVYDGTLGRWQLVSHVQGGEVAYSPTWTATSINPTIGNGSIAGGYEIVGQYIHFRAIVVMGSTTTYGTGTWLVSLPASQSVGSGGGKMMATAFDSSAAQYWLSNNSYNSATAIVLFSHLTGNWTSAVPFTWASGDNFSIDGFYRGA